MLPLLPPVNFGDDSDDEREWPGLFELSFFLLELIFEKSRPSEGPGELRGLGPDGPPLLVFSTAECFGIARVGPDEDEPDPYGAKVVAIGAMPDTEGAADADADEEIEAGVSLRFFSLSQARNLRRTILRGFGFLKICSTWFEILEVLSLMIFLGRPLPCASGLGRFLGFANMLPLLLVVGV